MLLTGAGGFTGSHVLEALLAGGAAASARQLEAAGVEHVPLDLAERTGFAEAVSGVDTVVHLAGLTRAATAAHFQGVERRGDAAARGGGAEGRREALRLRQQPRGAGACGCARTTQPDSLYGWSKRLAERQVSSCSAQRASRRR